MKWMQSLNRVVLLGFLCAVAIPVAAQDRIAWITDLREARDLAERENRLVLLHFWSETCPPCKRLEKNVFNQPEFIRAVSTGYIPVKINTEQQPKLAQFYNIESVPTDVIVTPQGRELQRFISKQDPGQYIAMLDGIRQQASVGNYAAGPGNTTQAATPVSVPINNQVQQSQSRYGQEANPYGVNEPQQGYAPNGSSSPGQANGPRSSPIENQFVNPLAQGAPPQQQNIAPRYANPYAHEANTNAALSTSRWGQSQPDHGTATTTEGQYVANRPSHDSSWQAGVAQMPEQRPASGNWQQEPPFQNSAQSNLAPHQNQPSHSAQPIAQQSPSPAPGQTATAQPDIALEGYCPVMLVQQHVWTPGDKKWGAVHLGRVYLFAGPDQQQQFLANPHTYAPLLSGFDPVRYAETGQLVPGRREFGLYIGEPGPIALFADEPALERFHANSNHYFNAIQQANRSQPGTASR